MFNDVNVHANIDLHKHNTTNNTISITFIVKVTTLMLHVLLSTKMQLKLCLTIKVVMLCQHYYV